MCMYVCFTLTDLGDAARDGESCWHTNGGGDLARDPARDFLHTGGGQAASGLICWSFFDGSIEVLTLFHPCHAKNLSQIHPLPFTFPDFQQADQLALTLQFMEDAGEKTSHDLADVKHAIHDLPEGWVTREMVQKTHAAIDNCLKKLHTLMQEPCQETQASLEFDKEGDQDHDNEGLSGVTDAEKLGDDTDDKNNEDENDGKLEIQALNDQTYVDDIMGLYINSDNVTQKLEVMAKILEGKLPWPAAIQLKVKDNVELSPSLDRCLQIGHSMNGMLECWKSALHNMPDSDQTNKKDAQETDGMAPTRKTKGKGRKSRSKGRGSTRKTKSKGKSKVKSKQLKTLNRLAAAKKADAAEAVPAPTKKPKTSKAPKTPKVAAKTNEKGEREDLETGKAPKTPKVAAKKNKKRAHEDLETGEGLPGENPPNSRLNDKDLQKKLHSVPSLQVAPNLTIPSTQHSVMRWFLFPIGLDC